MNKIFKEQIGWNAEVYVDDIIIKSRLFREHIKDLKEIKSRSFREHIEDLKEIFAALNKYQIKFNLAKCAFFITGGKFLGYMVSARGMEPNPEKV